YAPDFFIAKYSPSGQVIWAKGSKELDGAFWLNSSLSIDDHNHIYYTAMGGSGQCKVIFDGDTFSSAVNNNDAASLILELDTAGNVLCSDVLPGGSGSWNGIASDTSGNFVYFGCNAFGDLQFGKYTGDNVAVARWLPC